MIKMYITGQTLSIYSPVIAADSLNYLTAECYFDESWEGASKWAHFRQERDEEEAVVFDIALTEDKITEAQGLNLTVGEWEVYLTGAKADGSRLTVTPVIITVKRSGLVDAPLHQMPPTVAEQIAVRADTALSMAQTVLNAAEKGQFNGKDGKGVNVYESYFATLEDLKEEVLYPESGVLYGVGTEPPIEFYGWSEKDGEFVAIGPIQGAEGPQGKQGATFTPIVDDNGNLSWKNDGGLANPSTVNIRGPQGAQGVPGAEGKGPYEFAQEGGYTGTEKTLMDALVYLPQHHTRHEAGGLDPISITADMIPDGVVSREKVAKDVLYSPIISASVEMTINNSHIGKTIRMVNANGDFVINVAKDANIPVGAEIAIMNNFSKSNRIVFGAGIKACWVGCGSAYATSPKLTIPEQFSMIALKKNIV